MLNSMNSYMNLKGSSRNVSVTGSGWLHGPFIDGFHSFRLKRWMHGIRYGFFCCLGKDLLLNEFTFFNAEKFSFGEKSSLFYEGLRKFLVRPTRINLLSGWFHDTHGPHFRSCFPRLTFLLELSHLSQKNRAQTKYSLLQILSKWDQYQDCRFLRNQCIRGTLQITDKGLASVSEGFYLWVNDSEALENLSNSKSSVLKNTWFLLV